MVKQNQYKYYSLDKVIIQAYHRHRYRNSELIWSFVTYNLVNIFHSNISPDNNHV